MKKSFYIFLSLVFLILNILSCAKKQLRNYEEFIEYTKPNSEKLRIPVVIVPGMKGSLLKKGDDIYWGKSNRVSLLHTFDELMFPIYSDSDENSITAFGNFYNKKDIRDGGIIEKYGISLPFMNIAEVSIYENLKNVIIESGGYSLDNDLFLFSYDWRLDNRISAAHLAEMVKKYQNRYHHYLKNDILKGDENKYNYLIKYLCAQGLLDKNKRIKINIVSHSMGGLVSRYYIQVLGGIDCVNKIVMFGTPNQGAMDALKAIAEGEFPESLFQWYFKNETRPIIFSWPSTFQLLPRYSKCICDSKNQIVDLKNLGLSANSDDDIAWINVFENWQKYALIPDNDKFDYLDGTILKKYLEESLNSALKFYGSINGKHDKKYEIEKLQKLQKFCNLAKIEIDTETDFIHGHANIPYIIFGGNCEPTLKYASIRETNDSEYYLKFDNPWKDKEFGMVYTMGDGRVPIVSLKLPVKENPMNFQFLLCESHVGLVSNITFQYNLIRELLMQSYSISDIGKYKMNLIKLKINDGPIIPDNPKQNRKNLMDAGSGPPRT